MSKTDDGGPAFPINSPSGTPEYLPTRDGMSLRDWFAGQALQGLCAAPGTINWDQRRHAKAAYEYADAMIAARKAGDKQ
jgi:hypothetical protein